MPATQNRDATQFNWNQKPPSYDELPVGVAKCHGCDEHGNSAYVGVGVGREGLDCQACGGCGYHGIDTGPCESPKGSLHRILVYRKRYIETGEIYNADDSPDHEPNRLNQEAEPEPWTVPEVHEWDEED